VIMQSRDTPLFHLCRDVFVLLFFFHRRGEALPRDNRFAPKIEVLSRQAGVVGSRGSRILNYYLPGTKVLSGIKVRNRIFFHEKSSQVTFSYTERTTILLKCLFKILAG